jgi:hypothetical protein
MAKIEFDETKTNKESGIKLNTKKDIKLNVT